MTREEVERLSVDLSNRFEIMMTQMSLNNTTESIPNTSTDIVYVRLTEICNKWFLTLSSTTLSMTAKRSITT